MSKKLNELLIGLFICIILCVLYWGVNFLKGENLFSNKRFFYAVYDNINGLTISRPVTVNGFRIGQVSSINFNSHHHADLIVEISIEEDIQFSNNSILEIYDSDIMGTKSVQLKLIDGAQIAVDGDTLKGAIASGLTSEVSEQFGSVKVGLDQLIISFNKVLHEVKGLSSTANRMLLANEEKLSNSMNNIESISEVIQVNTDNINNILSNIASISNDVNSIDFEIISGKITNISERLEQLLINLDGNNGTVSKLLNTDSLYIELSNTINSMDNLLLDIKENPKKYVNISLFGGDKKNEK